MFERTTGSIDFFFEKDSNTLRGQQQHQSLNGCLAFRFALSAGLSFQFGFSALGRAKIRQLAGNLRSEIAELL
jgi:hypothetical protein